MEKGKKCPNCGYVATKNQDVCPNCDQFETQVFQPLTDEKITELTAKEAKAETPSALDEVVTVAEGEVADQGPSEPKEETSPETAAVEEVTVVPEESVEEEPTTGEPESKAQEEVAPPVATDSKSPASDSSPLDQAVTPPSPREEVVIDKFERPQIEEAREIVAAASKEKEAQKKAVASSQQPSESTKQHTSSEKKELSAKGKRNRMIAIVLVVLLALGGAYAAYSNYTAKKEAELVAKLKKESATLSLEAEKLYFNEERIFLSKDFDEAQLETLKSGVKDLDEKAEAKEDLTDMVVDLEMRAAKQTQLNSLFTTPILVGNALVKDAVLKDSEATVPTEIKPETDDLDKLLNEGRQEVEKQVGLNQTAAKLMKAIYPDKVNAKATQKMHDEAKASVAKLKDPSLKETYTKQLKEVQTELTKVADKKAKEKEEADKKAAAAQIPTKPQTQPAVNNNTTTNTAGTGGETPYGAGQGVTTQANKDSIVYVDVPEEGAWAWAPGVKERVISDSLSRGYIVEGGYVLRQKEVINGEGYYDLYATSTASSLLKNRSAEELPIYLVTINAKTGWYKGEGPN